MMQRVCGLSLALVLVHVGCAETEIRGRDVLRVGPLRDEPTLAARADPTRALALEAGRDVFDDDELSLVSAAVVTAFADEVGAQRGRAIDADARLDHCRVRAGAGRKHTIYRAKCRASLVRRETALVVVEAEVVRRVRSRAVTEDEIADIKRGARNPLLERDDSEAALRDAARATARRLLDPRRARSEELTQDDLTLDDEAGRKLSIARLARAKRPDEIASALVDLARYGAPEDGALAVPHLRHAHALPRRAAVMAIGELGFTVAIDDVAAGLTDADEDVRDDARRTLEILCALDDGGLFVSHAGAPQPPKPRSSNSSGEGAGVDGRIADAARNPSTWRQNAACSKR